MRPPPHEHNHKRHEREIQSDGDVADGVYGLLGAAGEWRVGEVVFLEYSEPRGRVES